MSNSTDFTIVVAVTPEKLPNLRWSLPTWPMKPQFKGRPIVVFSKGMSEGFPELEFIKEYFPTWTFVNWNFPRAESNREWAFSSFIFGTTSPGVDWEIKTPYFVKLDADAFFTTTGDVWNDLDFQYDLVGHRWSYTKPGWWIKTLDNFYNGTVDPVGDAPVYSHPRIASFCCLHKMEFVRKVADILRQKGGRLPVPSHDTTLWYYADKIGKWLGKSMRRLGVGDCTRFKSMREEICTGKCNNNPMLNRELLSHVQLELTSFCQLKCHNCDRNCGIAPSDARMDLTQIWKFVDESFSTNHVWKRIDLIGGEPTYHPELETIFKIVRMYKAKYPDCMIRFSTNGLGKHVEEVLKTIPSWVVVRNSRKKSREQTNFTAYNSAPCDNGEREVRCCSVPWRCGMALTRHGYFLCGAGAGVARVFGFDIGVKNLRDIQAEPETILGQIGTLCRYCGHSRVKSRHCTDKPEVSASWQKALDTIETRSISLY